MTANDCVDDNLRILGSQLKDCLRDSDQWNALWDRINELLEQRLESAREPVILESGQSLGACGI